MTSLPSSEADNKTCSKCRVPRPRSDFDYRRASKDGLDASCKTCRRKRRSDLYVGENVVANRKRAAQWRTENPTKAKVQKQKDYAKHGRARELKKHYGITLEQYAAMETAQEGLCAICRALGRGAGKDLRLHVDHDHKTGKVRGLLCGLCNTSLGGFRDSPELLACAISYLAKQRGG